jgi:crotonobetainyl-CoA:carnitine CoA-transferase CaiB-like acyl-CoA transferase
MRIKVDSAQNGILAARVVEAEYNIHGGIMSILPLQGIRVLDLSRLLPGPYLTQLMADLGAEVIKVETPLAGDHARLAPPEMGLGDMYGTINRGKKSLALNYRNARGRVLFLELAKTADVVLEGFRPTIANKYGIGYEDVRKVKPDIVYCSLSGYGQEGPYQQRAGHDFNYLSIGGAFALNGRPGERPIPYGLPVADLSGGMLAAIAILGALVGRERSGRGMYLDMALLDGVISWMTPLAMSAYFSGLEVGAGTHPLLGGRAFFNIYESSDGKYLTLAAIEPHFWGDFCKTIDRPDLIERQYDPALEPEIEAIFKGKTCAEWLELFADNDACVEPVNSVEEMLADPQVQARGHVRMEAGKPVGMKSPFVFARGERSPAPKLGADTRSLLHEIGVKNEEIDTLAARKIIAIR